MPVIITSFIAEKLHTGISSNYYTMIKYTKGSKITSLCGHKNNSNKS